MEKNLFERLTKLTHENYGDRTKTIYLLNAPYQKINLIKRIYAKRLAQGYFLGEIGVFRCSCEHDCCGCNFATEVEFLAWGENIFVQVINHYNY